VEDVLIETLYAPIAICAPRFVPQSLDEALEMPFQWTETRARNVTVRRCHIRQRPLAHCDRRDDHEFIERVQALLAQPGQDYGGFKAIHMRGDDINIEQNVVRGAGSCVMLAGCEHVRVARNVLRAGPSGHALYAFAKLTWPPNHPQNSKGAPVRGNYCREVLVEDNDIGAHSERARDLFYFYGGAENCHVARNRIADIEPTYDAEGLGCHLWQARWASARLEMTGPTTGRIVDPQGELTHEWLQDAVVEVVAGRGVGQLRRILRREGDELQLDRPWTVAPDETSRVVFTAPTPFHNMTFVDNDIRSTGINVILWGCSNDIVIDGNRSADAPGLTVWTVRLAADQKVWGGAAFTQIINNTVRERSYIGNHCYKHPTCTALGYDFLGLLIRNNSLENNSRILINGVFYGHEDPARVIPVHAAGILVEGNHIENGDEGIVADRYARALVRHNRFVNVSQPVRLREWAG